MEQQLEQLEQDLQVRLWPGAGGTEPLPDTRDPYAPSWWTSEEDASAQFLAAMGVSL